MKKILVTLLASLTAFQLGMTTVSAINTDSNIMQNDYLTLYVGQDEDNICRYQISANKGNLKNDNDNGKNLMYENFYSSYTTVVVNGKEYRFGEGERVSAPTYNDEAKTCTAVQKFGDVEVTQTLSFADGMKTGHDDMLLVTYSAKNTGSKDVLFGIRIMLDSELDKDDKCVVKADDALLNFEKEYKDSIPQQWSVMSEDGEITAYGKILTQPDSIAFADWSSLFDKKWNYKVDGAAYINDSATALVWNNKTLSVGQAEEYSVYYGVKNKATENSNPTESSNPEENSETENPTESSAVENSTDNSVTENSTDNSVTDNSKENSVTENSNSVFTGQDTTLLSTLIVALMASVSVIVLALKKRGGSKHE
ncbi:MAG: hypothetical protein PUG48_00740 [Clostridia bacterium]|nr:hypothetical protein [Clostridia bacterium]